MNQVHDKLPLEYPVGDMLKMYGRRLLIFLSVIAANLILLGFVVLLLSVKMDLILDFIKTNLLQLLNTSESTPKTSKIFCRNPNSTVRKRLA